LTAVDVVTDLVVTVKPALEAPAGTVTLDGTTATPVLLLESATTAPPEGAGPLRMTVPCEGLPPVTPDGLSVNPDSATGAGAGVGVGFGVGAGVGVGVGVGVGFGFGGGGAPRFTSNERTADHAPLVPPAVRPRTRHQQRLSPEKLCAYCVCASPSCDASSGALNLSESSI
jgi:hypothetical protein